jgi:hypothetical protein
MDRKEGSKTNLLVAVISIIIILSISLVSAGLFEDVIKVFFGNFAKSTGFVTTEYGECTDSDGYGDFETEGSVTVNQIWIYWDYCDGDIAHDRFCYGLSDPPTGGGVSDPADAFRDSGTDSGGDDSDDDGNNGSTIAFFSLPITGYANIPPPDVPPPTVTKDCAAEGKTCWGKGICGCNDGDVLDCSEGQVLNNPPREHFV